MGFPPPPPPLPVLHRPRALSLAPYDKAEPQSVALPAHSWKGDFHHVGLMWRQVIHHFQQQKDDRVYGSPKEKEGGRGTPGMGPERGEGE